MSKAVLGARLDDPVPSLGATWRNERNDLYKLSSENPAENIIRHSFTKTLLLDD